jgi:hypothetical protein
MADTERTSREGTFSLHSAIEAASVGSGTMPVFRMANPPSHEGFRNASAASRPQLTRRPVPLRIILLWYLICARLGNCSVARPARSWVARAAIFCKLLLQNNLRQLSWPFRGPDPDPPPEDSAGAAPMPGVRPAGQAGGDGSHNAVPWREPRAPNRQWPTRMPASGEAGHASRPNRPKLTRPVQNLELS